MRCLTACYGIAILLSVFISLCQADDSPSFISTPQNKTVKKGTQVVKFSCKVSGFPVPNIRWLKDGVMIDSGKDGYFIGGLFKSLYIMQAVQIKHAGKYTCVATNNLGTIRAHAYLTIVTATAPTWITQPHDVTLYNGQEYTMPCKASGFPDPWYKWTKGIFPVGIADPTIQALFNGNLFFSSAAHSHAGRYKCAAGNSKGRISRTVQVDVVDDPSIIRHPKDTEDVVGGTVLLQCAMVGNPMTTVVWTKDGSKVKVPGSRSRKSVDVKTLTNTVKLYTLKITRAVPSDAGQYKCVVSNSNGLKKSNAAKLHFSASAEAPNVTIPVSKITAAKGSDVTLKCHFSGTPLPQVKWYKNGKVLLHKGTVNKISEISLVASLEILGIGKHNEGMYVCYGTNIAGNTSAAITLTLQREPQKPKALATEPSVTALRDHSTALQCFIIGHPRPFITWHMNDEEMFDESVTVMPGTNSTVFKTILTLKDVQFKDTGRYICRGQNSYGMAEANVTLIVKGRPARPTDLKVNLTSSTTVYVTWIPGYEGGSTVSYVAEYKHNQTLAWTVVEVGVNTSVTLSDKDGWHTVVFRVWAKNVYGKSEPSNITYISGNEVENPILHPHALASAATIGAAVGGVAVLILAILLLLVVLRKRSLKKSQPRYTAARSVTYTTTDSDNNRDSSLSYSYVTTRHDNDPVQPQFAEENDYDMIAKTKNWEVPKRCLTIGKELGQGHFGKVFKGIMKTKSGSKIVAVKMLKENVEEQPKKDFMSELELMQTLAPHPNIVCLLGCCTKGDNPYIIVEYCTLGNLLEVLRKSQGSRIYTNLAGGSHTLTSRDLLSFMWQVARGMSYLASMKLVHRDLAARNILVDKGNVCKIADFGLARDIYEENQYLKTTEGELPLRWMAYESVFKGITTIESDIWSFGILMWEIVTLGAKPYPGMLRDQLISNLHIGYRMPRPPYCSEELYSVIWECWQLNPSDRPTFSILCRTLNRMIAAEKVFIDLSSFDAEYINASHEGGEEASASPNSPS